MNTERIISDFHGKYHRKLIKNQEMVLYPISWMLDNAHIAMNRQLVSFWNIFNGKAISPAKIRRHVFL